MPVTAASPLRTRLADRAARGLYAGWARWGPLSAAIARQVRPAGRPVLLVSLPRSGSSWVGGVLGEAPDALYLREPVSERRRAAGAALTVVPVDADRPDPVVASASALAFGAVPVFPRGVVAAPRQWALHRRRRGRLVVKEVNPLALAYWARAYRPLVVFLVRHPAAVALSYRRLGWLGNPDVSAERPDRPDASAWETCGRRQGLVHRAALDALRDYPDGRVVRYEDLCRDPEGEFRALFAFAGLGWSGRVREAVAVRASGGDRASTFGTRRDSRRMADAWRGEIAPGELDDLRRGYTEAGAQLYAAPEDWEAAPAPPR